MERKCRIVIRIGLIGTQSMHAWSFAKCCNVPNENGEYLVPDCRVVAICGIDDTKEHIEETADIGNVPLIVDSPEKLCDLCDAIMVLTRKGDTHIKYALPFIQKGYPVFIDKPVCISDEDISILENEVEMHDCIIAGGSGLKNGKSLKELKEIINSDRLGNIKGISINHNADIDCEYNGIYFYACHAVEILLELLGRDICSVDVSVLSHDNFTVCVKYTDKFANLIFISGCGDYFANIYGDKKSVSYKIDQSDIFSSTIIDFADRIRNNKITKSIDDLVEHIYVLRKINDAIKK